MFDCTYKLGMTNDIIVLANFILYNLWFFIDTIGVMFQLEQECKSERVAIDDEDMCFEDLVCETIYRV